MSRLGGSRRRLAAWIAIAVVGLFLLAQAVPYGRAHDNPAPSRDVRWSDATTKQLFAGACADCHSDHTEWPWYSNVAPVSWLVQSDVEEGRGVLDTSRWDEAQPAVDELVDEVMEGGMPPRQYKAIHKGARLSDSQRRALADGLRRTYEADPPASTYGG